MSRVIRRGSAGLYVLAVLVSLTFGATQAFAKRDPVCNLAGVKTCLTATECNEYCQSLGNPDGICNSNHCCICRIE
jgi:hypothetical protein